MTYKTQPGTLPHRVMGYLRTQPPGTELSTAEICEALDAELQGFPYSMATAVRHGLMVRRMRPDNRRLLYWSLPAADAPAAPMVEAKPTPQAAAPIQQNEPEPQPQPTKPRKFRAAMWTDGTIDLEVGSSFITLDQAEAAQLSKLIHRQAS